MTTTSKAHQRITFLIFLGLYLAGSSGCGRHKQLHGEKYNETRLLMGTIVQLDVCRTAQNAPIIEGAYQGVWIRLEDISWRMNIFDHRSDVSKINRAGSSVSTVQADTYGVLQSASYYSKLTDGAFDITVLPLIDLWRESAKTDLIPAEERIYETRNAVSWEHVQLLPEYQVRLLNDKARIDLGGIAKGYAIDEAARIFREHGIKDFFIDAGGDTYVGGRNCDGGLWRIGIRDPEDRTKIIDLVRIADAAVATSGNYEQSYQIQGQKWSHIINPMTGYPQKDVISATVIAPSATEADALATALCVLGGKLGTDLINSLPQGRASLIMVKENDGPVAFHYSRGYKRYHNRLN